MKKLIPILIAVMLFTVAAPAKAWLDGGWGTTSFNLYESPHSSSGGYTQTTSGWGSFWSRLFGHGGSVMPTVYQ